MKQFIAENFPILVAAGLFVLYWVALFAGLFIKHWWIMWQMSRERKRRLEEIRWEHEMEDQGFVKRVGPGGATTWTKERT